MSESTDPAGLVPESAPPEAYATQLRYNVVPWGDYDALNPPDFYREVDTGKIITAFAALVGKGDTGPRAVRVSDKGQQYIIGPTPLIGIVQPPGAAINTLVIPINNPDQFAPGEIVYPTNSQFVSNGFEDWYSRVTGASASSITLGDPLPEALGAGDSVYVVPRTFVQPPAYKAPFVATSLYGGAGFVLSTNPAAPTAWAGSAFTTYYALSIAHLGGPRVTCVGPPGGIAPMFYLDEGDFANVDGPIVGGFYAAAAGASILVTEARH